MRSKSGSRSAGERSGRDWDRTAASKDAVTRTLGLPAGTDVEDEITVEAVLVVIEHQARGQLPGFIEYRLVEVLILVGIALALGMMALFVFTGVIIFAVPEAYRIWVACGLGAS